MATPTSPSEIARETLKALAARKLPPTPDNYAQAYLEISGVAQEPSGAVAVIEHIAQHLALESPPNSAASQALKQSIATQNWEQCQNELQKLLLPATQKELSQSKAEPAPELLWSGMIRDLLRQIDTPHKGITMTRKKEGVETVLNSFT